MSRHRKNVRALRRAVGQKTGRRWSWSHAWVRFVRVFERLRWLLIYFVMWCLIANFLSGGQMMPDQSPAYAATAIALVFTGFGLIQFAVWVSKSLFSARTRFFLTIPAPFGTLNRERICKLITQLITLGLAFTLLTYLCWIYSDSSDLAESKGLGPVQAGLISWAGFLGALGVSAPWLARRRPAFNFGAWLKPAVYFGLFLLFFANVQLGYWIGLCVKAALPLLEWLPPAWGILDLIDAMPIDGAWRVIVPFVITLAGLLGLISAVGLVLRLLRENTPALLSPHFNHETTAQLAPQPQHAPAPPSSSARIRPPERTWRDPLRRFLGHWMTPEERLAARMNYEDGLPKLGSVWLFGTSLLAAAVTLTFFVVALQDRARELHPVLLVVAVSLPGLLAISGFVRLLRNSHVYDAFQPRAIGVTRAPRIAGLPVRWTDLVRVELKIAAIQHAAGLIPLQTAAALASRAIGYPVGEGMLIGLLLQVYLITIVTGHFDQSSKAGLRVSIRSIWYWILLVVRIGGVAVHIGALGAAIALFLYEPLRAAAFLPPLAAAAINFALWWFVYRQAYNACHSDLDLPAAKS